MCFLAFMLSPPVVERLRGECKRLELRSQGTHTQYLVSVQRFDCRNRHDDYSKAFTHSVEHFKDTAFFAPLRMGNIINQSRNIALPQVIVGQIALQCDLFVKFDLHYCAFLPLCSRHQSWNDCAANGGKSRFCVQPLSG